MLIESIWFQRYPRRSRTGNFKKMSSALVIHLVFELAQESRRHVVLGLDVERRRIDGRSRRRLKKNTDIAIKVRMQSLQDDSAKENTFCMARKARIDLTSASYEASAIVLPLAAKRHAAIHFAYWVSCFGVFFFCASLVGNRVVITIPTTQRPSCVKKRLNNEPEARRVDADIGAPLATSIIKDAPST